MMISGIWWFFITLIVFIVLYTIGKYKGLHNNKHQPKKNTKSTKADKVSMNKFSLGRKSTMHKLKIRLTRHLPEYHFELKNQHITIIKKNKKIAMITVDRLVPIGNRKLGNIMVINYHQPPTHTQVIETLKEKQ